MYRRGSVAAEMRRAGHRLADRRLTDILGDVVKAVLA
jgi:hypothetical protein